MQNKKLITHLNFAKGFRGGERQTLLLIEELSLKGYTQKLFTRIESELAIKAKNVKNLEIIKISKPYIFSFKKFKDSEILHAHETKAAQVAYFVKKIFDIPYIITRRVDNKIKNNIFSKALYSNSFRTVALSKAIREGIEDITKNVNIEIIPSSSTPFSLNEDKISLIKKRFEGKFLVGNIGELDNTHKGQFYLIEAIKKVEKDYKNIHFIFLGKGKDAQNYKKQAKDLNNITFEGFVPNVGDYISCMDLFVFPSLNEGLGSILFDVMKQKVPIIASNVGGIPDIVENNKSGILISSKNSELIYENIIKLYKDKILSDKLANEAYINSFNFDPKIMCEAYERLYSKTND